ncbi:MAG: diheme cytochrome c [Betaproteobacteria bacterium]
MSANPRFRIRNATLALILSLGSVAVAAAADDRRAPGVPLLPAYRQECAACHAAYPPGMLPAASWQRIVGNLSRHYGADASLDAATANELSAWLTARAGTYKRVRGEAPPDDRITRSSWFIRKHNQVPAATWKLSAVKVAANCAACHPQAERGDFNEHDIRIPR